MLSGNASTHRQRIHDAVQEHVFSAAERLSKVYSDALMERLNGNNSPQIFTTGEHADLFRELVSLQMRITELLTPKYVRLLKTIKHS